MFAERPDRPSIPAQKLRQSVRFEDLPQVVESREGISEIENERRFAVTDLSAINFLKCRYDVISQGYVTGVITDTQGHEVGMRPLRVRSLWSRKKGERYRMNTKEEMKKGDRQHRKETQWHLNGSEFTDMWPKTEGHRVTKVRFYVEVPYGKKKKWVIEVDIFVHPSDLVLAEVEFKNEKSAKSFNPADIPWLGEEVTQDGKLGNASLATHGKPDTAPQTPIPPELRDYIAALVQERNAAIALQAAQNTTGDAT